MSDTNDTVVSSYQGGPTELDTEAASFISELAAEYKAEAVAEQEAAPVEAAPVAQENTVAPPEPKPEDRGMERLVEREVALRTRESELVARESRAAALEDRIKRLEGRAIPDEVMARMEYEPEEALKHIGIDPEQLVRQVIANRLGDKADPSVRQTIESAKFKKELNELRAQVQEQNRAAAAQAFIAEVQAGAREYVTKGVGEKDTPTVAAVAKANPERVYREIMEEISRDASTRAAKDPNGNLMPYPEAAKRVEARWAEFKALITPANPTATPASTTSPAAIVPGAKAPSVIKSPDRPIAPWLQRGDLEEEGIKAAMAEYNRSEGTRTR